MDTLYCNFPLQDYTILEDKICKTLKRPYTDGSGTDFETRDLVFYYKHSKPAFEAFKKLRKLRNLNSVRLQWSREE